MINLFGLIQMYNTYDHKNVYYNVARCLLKNYNRIDTMTSTQIAELCNVSPSTLNRFYRMMSFPMTVSQLPNLVSMTKDNYMFDGNYVPVTIKNTSESSVDYYMHDLLEAINSFYKSIDKSQIKKLVEEIALCRKVVFLGCPIPQGIWRFQMDLALKGIETCAFMDPNYQYEALAHLEKDTIVFYTQYYRLGDNRFKKSILACRDRIKKLVVMTNNQAHPLSPLADYVFMYPGNATERDAILMNIYINLIAMTFCEIRKENSI